MIERCLGTRGAGRVWFRARARAQPALLGPVGADRRGGTPDEAARLLLAIVGQRRSSSRRTRQAHPLGNFTINRYSRVEPSGDRLYVLYVLDLAEIPTFQARAAGAAEGEAAYAAAPRRRDRRDLDLT